MPCETGNFGISDVGYSANPTFADIDNDGDLDALVRNSVGILQFFENTIKNRPVLSIPASINYTDTKFDDSFAIANGTLTATDADGDALTYGIAGGIDNIDGTTSLAIGLVTLTVNKTTGDYKFVARDVFIEALTVNAARNFTITVSDGLLVDSKLITLNITQSGVTESNGNDSLTGTAGSDSFNGLAGNDNINGVGNTVNNIISGNSGNNILNGWDGIDTLTGGLGKDIFRLATLSRDRITDFSVADDTIQLENGIFTQMASTGVLSANNFKFGAATDADDFIHYNSATGILSYDSNGNGAGGATQIAVLGVGLALTNTDFGVI